MTRIPGVGIVPIYAVWQQYAKALGTHKAPVPAPTASGLGYLTDRGDFAAGCCFFPADRLIVAEFLVTNPEIPMWERHHAVVEMAKAFQTHAIGSGKTPWVMVRHRGVARAIERAGFKSNGAVCYHGSW